MYNPVRGGTRGGQGDFKWSDVAADKDRENYLGHSLNAPVGRWQKNKDLTWYNKDGEAGDAERAEEIRRIKEAEEDALSAALGFAPAVRAPRPPAPDPNQAVLEEAAKARRKEERRKDKEERHAERERKRAERAQRKREERPDRKHSPPRGSDRSPDRKRDSSGHSPASGARAEDLRGDQNMDRHARHTRRYSRSRSPQDRRRDERDREYASSRIRPRDGYRERSRSPYRR